MYFRQCIFFLVGFSLIIARVPKVSSLSAREAPLVLLETRTKWVSEDSKKIKYSSSIIITIYVVLRQVNIWPSFTWSLNEMVSTNDCVAMKIRPISFCSMAADKNNRSQGRNR